MLDILIATAAISLSPSPQDVCHGDASAPPVTDEYGRYVPGFGRVTGLNDDFHDSVDDPEDVPGSYIRVVAADGSIQLLPAYVGADCPPAASDE